MAYPTGMIAFVLEDTDRQIAAMKFTAQQVRNESAAGNIPSSRILNFYVNLQEFKLNLVAARDTPGIGPYAQTAKNNTGLDIVAEFNGLLTQVDGAISWITVNFPKDGGGFLLAKTFTGTTIADRLFTSAQTAGFRTTLDSVIAAIA